MVNFIELNDGSLRPDEVNDTAARVCREEGYNGYVYSLPKSGGVIVAAAPGDGTGEYETERVFKHIAIELGAEPEDGEGNNPFRGEDDCDLDFFESIPAPEEEIGPIWLRFSINDIGGCDKASALERLCEERGYECGIEADGATVYLEYLVALDLYFDRHTDYIDGELDASYAGAGLFAEGCEFARELAKRVGGRLEFVASGRVSYPIDQDFGKLQQLFYGSIKQQLAFALADDRDGIQAYVGWSVDTYEPEEIPGSIITHLGRVNIDRLRSEIQSFGFEATADRHFLMRNCRNGGASDYQKTALALLWCDISPERIKFRIPSDSFRPEEVALEMLDKAISLDKSIPIPLMEYDMLHRLDHSQIGVEALSHPQYQPHYPIGYLNGDIYYGFGSYLRHFRLTGGFYPIEIQKGHQVRLEGDTGRGGYACIIVTIDYSGKEPKLDGIIPSGAEIRDFDLGGSSFCRLGSFSDAGSYKAIAVITIRDESYILRCTTDDPDFQSRFADIVAGCRAIEDVDDLIPANPSDKPRAWGACYFLQSTQRLPLSAVLDQLEPILAPFRLPETTLKLTDSPTTDISSKFGGVPYCQPGMSFPEAEDRTPLDFVLQLNFAELNPTGFLEKLPRRGILQLWMEDFRSAFNKNCRIYTRQDKFRLVWYPEPSGGYLTEQKGIALTAIPSMLLPTPFDYRCGPMMHELDKRAHGIIEDYFVELSVYLEHRNSHLGGSPDLPGPDSRLDADSKLNEANELLFQLWMPENRGWLDIYISPERLSRCDFSDAVLTVFGRERGRIFRFGKDGGHELELPFGGLDGDGNDEEDDDAEI